MIIFRLELENKQQKTILETKNNTNAPYSNNIFDRDSGISVSNYTNSSRGFSNLRRDSETEFLNSYKRNYIDSHDVGKIKKTKKN